MTHKDKSSWNWLLNMQDDEVTVKGFLYSMGLLGIAYCVSRFMDYLASLPPKDDPEENGKED